MITRGTLARKIDALGFRTVRDVREFIFLNAEKNTTLTLLECLEDRHINYINNQLNARARQLAKEKLENILTGE